MINPALNHVVRPTSYYPEEVEGDYGIIPLLIAVAGAAMQAKQAKDGAAASKKANKAQIAQDKKDKEKASADKKSRTMLYVVGGIAAVGIAATILVISQKKRKKR